MIDHEFPRIKTDLNLTPIKDLTRVPVAYFAQPLRPPRSRLPSSVESVQIGVKPFAFIRSNPAVEGQQSASPPRSFPSRISYVAFLRHGPHPPHPRPASEFSPSTQLPYEKLSRTPSPPFHDVSN